VAVRVLFVCLGNICRSPAAEAALTSLVEEAGLAEEFIIDSAGTGRWHVGERADARMRAAASRRGLEITSIARQVSADDFERFDHILAMDRENLQELSERAPSRHRSKVRLFRDFDPEDPGADVPDPYYGGPDGFDDVLNIVTRTARAWLNDIGPRAATSKPDPS